VYRSLTFIETKNGSIVPSPEGYDDLDKKMKKTIEEAPERVGKHIERFKFLDALKEYMAVAHFGNEYFQKKEPWKNKNATTLYLCANLCRTLAIVGEPFLPYTAEEIWKTLNLKGSVHDEEWEDAGELKIEGGHKIGKVKTLYRKIEDEELDSFQRKYLNLGKETKMEPTKVIEFEEFKGMDLRVGKIVSASDHPKADKLYILKVDLGVLGERQIVAGIKPFYSKEELNGRNVVVIANLAPAELRGQRSEGMVLAADVEGKAVLLQPDKDVSPGSKIR